MWSRKSAMVDTKQCDLLVGHHHETERRRPRTGRKEFSISGVQGRRQSAHIDKGEISAELDLLARHAGALLAHRLQTYTNIYAE